MKPPLRATHALEPPIPSAAAQSTSSLSAVKTPTSVEAILASELRAAADEEPVASPRAAQTPILASQALMEDIAPVEPGRREARRWCAVFGLVFLFFGTLPLLRLLPGRMDAAVPWLLTGCVALVASVVRVAYRERAVAMVVLGVLSGLVAVEANAGALARADGGVPWGVVRFVAAVTLAGALLFRARYRAYKGARIVLGVALAVAVPFVAHAVVTLRAAGAFGPAQAASAFAVLTVGISLAGFMGSDSTGVGMRWALLTVVAFALDIGVRTELGSRGWSQNLGGAVATLGFGAAATLAALGLFQVLAWRFAADARRIDLHAVRRDTTETQESERTADWFRR
jgi:hypothetical protein